MNASSLSSTATVPSTNPHGWQPNYRANPREAFTSSPSGHWLEQGTASQRESRTTSAYIHPSSHLYSSAAQSIPAEFLAGGRNRRSEMRAYAKRERKQSRKRKAPKRSQLAMFPVESKKSTPPVPIPPAPPSPLDLEVVETALNEIPDEFITGEGLTREAVIKAAEKLRQAMVYHNPFSPLEIQAIISTNNGIPPKPELKQEWADFCSHLVVDSLKAHLDGTAYLQLWKMSEFVQRWVISRNDPEHPNPENKKLIYFKNSVTIADDPDAIPLTVRRYRMLASDWAWMEAVKTAVGHLSPDAPALASMAMNLEPVNFRKIQEIFMYDPFFTRVLTLMAQADSGYSYFTRWYLRDRWEMLKPGHREELKDLMTKPQPCGILSHFLSGSRQDVEDILATYLMFYIISTYWGQPPPTWSHNTVPPTTKPLAAISVKDVNNAIIAILNMVGQGAGQSLPREGRDFREVPVQAWPPGWSDDEFYKKKHDSNQNKLVEEEMARRDPDFDIFLHAKMNAEETANPLIGMGEAADEKDRRKALEAKGIPLQQLEDEMVQWRNARPRRVRLDAWIKRSEERRKEINDLRLAAGLPIRLRRWEEDDEKEESSYELGDYLDTLYQMFVVEGRRTHWMLEATFDFLDRMQTATRLSIIWLEKHKNDEQVSLSTSLNRFLVLHLQNIDQGLSALLSASNEIGIALDIARQCARISSNVDY